MFRKRVFWIIVLAVLLAAGGGGYYYYKNVYAKAQTADAQSTTTSTAQVQRGDIIISASGSGTLEPGTSLDVSFRNSGVLAELPVKVGDKVKVGQLLARLDDTDAQTQVSQAQISLRQAEINLAQLTAAADPADLAAAQGNLASAKASLTQLTSPAGTQEVLAARQSLKSAQDNLKELLALPDPDVVASAKADLTLAEMNLRAAQTAYDQVASRPDVAMTQQAIDLWQATTNYDKALAAYNEALKGATADEIATARSQVAQAQASLDALLADPDPDEVAAAQAKVDQTQAQLEAVLSGASATDLELAQLNVQQAQLSLDSAQRTLAETELVAPAAGTIVAVNGQAGEPVSSGAIVTLADLDTPVLLFWVEETDMADVAVGNAINITFDALPDNTFTGKILSVDPALVTVSNTPAVQATASIDLSTHPVQLLSGMNATVEVVAAEARNALLVPVEALREISAGQYAVMVVKSNGEMELRTVEVGLKDVVNVEILSGLQEGETISLATTSSSQSSTQSTVTSPFDNMQGPMPPFDGGQP